MRTILQFAETNWRSWALCALGALILWVGFSEIVDGDHLDMLGPITVMAAIGFPYALSKWFPRR